MTYAYRDPARMRRHPVGQPEPTPEPTTQPAPKPPRARRKRAARKPPTPTPSLPPPVYGGRTGLHLAAEESAALDRRTKAMIAAGHDSPWIREYKRIHNIK